jgi:HD superfamily phosphohydrolase YqeK
MSHSARLPSWARASSERRAHIDRVVQLLLDWSHDMELDPAEEAEWRDAGLWHDALRDATESELRVLLPGSQLPAELLHGPAAAARLEADGESRTAVLDAVRYHTVGSRRWARTGRALYMADFLEPGREFSPEERRALRELVPVDFDAAFRATVHLRAKWLVAEGRSLPDETLDMLHGAR